MTTRMKPTAVSSYIKKNLDPAVRKIRIWNGNLFGLTRVILTSSKLVGLFNPRGGVLHIYVGRDLLLGFEKWTRTYTTIFSSWWSILVPFFPLLTKKEEGSHLYQLRPDRTSYQPKKYYPYFNIKCEEKGPVVIMEGWFCDPIQRHILIYPFVHRLSSPIPPLESP